MGLLKKKLTREGGDQGQEGQTEEERESPGGKRRVIWCSPLGPRAPLALVPRDWLSDTFILEADGQTEPSSWRHLTLAYRPVIANSYYWVCPEIIGSVFVPYDEREKQPLPNNCCHVLTLISVPRSLGCFYWCLLSLWLLSKHVED